jgi:hypothetical protein
MIFQRKGAKTQRKKPIKTRLFATLRLCVKPIFYAFTQSLFNPANPEIQ